MGHDVYIIGNHNLNTSNLEALARDLSNRFKANVEYGVYDIFSFDWDGFHREASYEYWVFGRVEYPDAKKTLWLADEFYLYHIVYGRYGEDVYKLPYFTEYDLNRKELEDALNNVCFELRDNAEDEVYGTIFNDTFHDWNNYFNSSWGGFSRAFTEDNDDEYLLSIVNEYRYEVMDFFEKIGGIETFYFDDQGKTQYLTEIIYDWKTILKEVETNFKETTLRISDFMKQNKLLPKGEYPLVFYDDFTDLRNRDQIRNFDRERTN